MSTLSQKLRLYLITDDKLRPCEQLAEIIGAAIAGGVTAVQFREKQLTGEYLLQAYAAVSRECRKGEIPLVINAEVFRLLPNGSAIEGIHAGERTWPLPPFPRSPRIGYSAHSPDEIAQVTLAGADFVTLSPVFETSSKPGQPGGGPALIAACRAAAPDAVIIGLGGINERNAERVIRAGADGIAVISSIMDSRNPFAQARRLREMVENALDG